jgi:hypothetical protein
MGGWFDSSYFVVLAITPLSFLNQGLTKVSFIAQSISYLLTNLMPEDKELEVNCN